jgi:signal transduction histidine kinase
LTATLAGWLAALAAFAWALRVRHRREGVIRAEHELRSALCALRLGLDADGRLSLRAVAAQFDRVDAGLDLLVAACGRRPRPVVPGAVSLELVARESAVAWSAAARALGRSVEVDWDAGAAMVRADRRHLAQVTGNLIANALEHGRGAVRLKGVRRGLGFVLSVSDEGPAAAKPRAGTGRGLRIAGAAAGRSGGTVALDSGPDGTVATLELPAAGS